MVNLIFVMMLFTLAISESFAQKEDIKTVKIGNQVWMAKNLDVTTFRNGDPIPEAKTAYEWRTAGTDRRPAWCYYDNNEQNGKKYGKLYNWYAVIDSRGLAPQGYHIPSEAEWTVLIDFLGETKAGSKLKSKKGWADKKWGGDNSTGFNGLPGGCRFSNMDPSFSSIGFTGTWWCYTEGSYSNLCTHFLNEKDYVGSYKYYSEKDGFSIRCIKD